MMALKCLTVSCRHHNGIFCLNTTIRQVNMKKSSQENQTVISKMSTILKPINLQKGTNITPQSFAVKGHWEKNPPLLEVHYAFHPTQAVLEKNGYLSMEYLGNYQCCSCQKVVKKIYSGYCYVCLIKKASADMCILNPYKCHFSQGTCREPDWALQFCYQPHFVYLA
jgi:hypothetical protein